MSTIYVIPAPDTVVLNPANKFRPVSPDGEWTVWSDYWARRAIAGEITIHDAPPVRSSKKKPKVETNSISSSDNFEEII